MPAQKLHKGGQGNTGPAQKEDASGRSRLYCFTHYDCCTHVPKLDSRQWSYICVGRETCPKTGRNHWQGWVYFVNGKTPKAASDCLEVHFGQRPHTEKCRGKVEHQEAYCEKEGQWYEWGSRPSQGKRVDLDSVAAEVYDGSKTTDQIALSSPVTFHQYGRTLQYIEDLRLRQTWRTEMTECIWFHGPTGVGKSHFAFEGYHPDTHYLWTDDGGWWDGYRQQHTVILNDYRGEMPYNKMLQLIDKWPFNVRRRHREPMPFTSKMVIITSSLPPEAIYHRRLEEDNIAQLLRRCRVVLLSAREEHTIDLETLRELL